MIKRTTVPCPVCDRVVIVRITGQLWRHPGIGPVAGLVRPSCPGSGLTLAAAWDRPSDSVPDRDLVGAELWDQLVARLVSKVDIPEAALTEAVTFLRGCAHSGPLTPSPSADIAWHELILHTREYAAFCQRIAGRFIHHQPSGDECGGNKCCSCTAALSGVPLDGVA